MAGRRSARGCQRSVRHRRSGQRVHGCREARDARRGGRSAAAQHHESSALCSKQAAKRGEARSREAVDTRRRRVASHQRSGAAQQRQRADEEARRRMMVKRRHRATAVAERRRARWQHRVACGCQRARRGSCELRHLDWAQLFLALGFAMHESRAESHRKRARIHVSATMRCNLWRLVAAEGRRGCVASALLLRQYNASKSAQAMPSCAKCCFLEHRFSSAAAPLRLWCGGRPHRRSWRLCLLCGCSCILPPSLAPAA